MKYLYTILATIVIAGSSFASPVLNEQLTVLKAAKAKIESTQNALKKAESNLEKQKTSINQLKGDIQKERDEKNAISNELKATKEKYEKLKIKQLQTGRERDLFIIAFSILATLSLFGIIRPFLTLIPPPYSYAVYIASPVAIFFGIFFGIRLLVQLIVKFIF